MKKLIVALSVVAVVAAGLVPVFAEVKVNEKAPSVSLKDVTERYVFLSRLCGDKVGTGEVKYAVVLDFCATWCKPCMKEMPILQKIFDDYKKNGVKMFLVSVDTMRKTEVAKFFDEKNVTIPILFDSEKTAVDKYGVAEFPSLFIINQDGVVVFKQIGYKEDIDKDIRGVLDKLASATPVIASGEDKTPAVTVSTVTVLTPEQIAAQEAASKRDQAKVFNDQAMQFYNMGQYESAVTECEKALAIDPSYKFADMLLKKAKAKITEKQGAK